MSIHTMDIAGRGYQATDPQDQPIPLETALIRLAYLTHRGMYKANCACGQLITVPDSVYDRGFRIYGGPRPPRRVIGMQISKYSREISLYCGTCGNMQKYVRRDICDEYEK